ncbi:TPA: hypothetical protein P8677_004960 [Klebsiella pneumoniae]|jgi:hypothetical protein|nr:hypothetical protein [Klebsiella pneumoniae]
MINFKDFEHDRDRRSKASGDYGNGEKQAFIDMNVWIESKNIEVISIETMTSVRGNMASTGSRFNAFRLWYKEK